MMEPLLRWGLDLIRTVQTIANPALTFFMKMATQLGGTLFYVILLSLIFWCIDEKKSVRLALLIMISGWINLLLKFLLHQPRPFWEAYDPSVALVHEQFGGLPSGHAQGSLIFWTLIASWGAKTRYYVLAAAIILLVGFSRVYLGVHFPTDVLAGWLIGGLICRAYFFLAPRIEKALESGGLRARMILSAGVSFVIILYRPSNDFLMLGGALLGIGIGYTLNIHFIHFKAAGLRGRGRAAKLLVLPARFILGFVGIFLIAVVFSRFLPNSDSVHYRLFFFLHYALLGFWIYAGAPWLFLRIGLAEKGYGNE
jgi:membrane-associated phospholipid phosphatase